MVGSNGIAFGQQQGEFPVNGIAEFEGFLQVGASLIYGYLVWCTTYDITDMYMLYLEDM